MGFRALRSLTFFVGLLLFIGSFAAIVLFGAIFNPAPYQIAVALHDLPPYTILEPAMVGVDAQTMASQVAVRLVHEAELDTYLGGMLIEPVHAGEPLRRMAIVAPDNPAARKRIALALSDPDKVAMVIPADPDIVPDSVQPGDFVNITMAVGQVQQMDERAAGLAGSATATPAPASVEEVTERAAANVVLPFAKIVLQDVLVLQVQKEKIQNPGYGAGFSDQASSEPAYIDGDLQRLVALVPADAQEMVAFAIANGALQLTLAPHVAVHNALPGSTFGITWDDFKAFFRAEREKSIAAGQTGPVPVREMIGWAQVTGEPDAEATPTAVPAASGATETTLPTTLIATVATTAVRPTQSLSMPITPAPWATPVAPGSASPAPTTPSSANPPAVAPQVAPPTLPEASTPQPGGLADVTAMPPSQALTMLGLVCAPFVLVLVGGIFVLRLVRRRGSGGGSA